MKEIQKFSVLDALSVLGLLAAVFSSILYVLVNSFEDPGLKRAYRTAFVLSGQLVAGGVSTLPAGVIQVDKGVGRGPANIKKGLFLQEGEISKDPWGRPYHYRFLMNEEGFPEQLLVWSDGPNRSRETKSRNLAKRISNGPDPVVFMGDDVGVIRTLKSKLLAKGKNNR